MSAPASSMAGPSQAASGQADPVELRNLNGNEAASQADSDDAAPTYATNHSFNPTTHFQIETKGRPFPSLPITKRPDPIPVFAVTPDMTPDTVWMGHAPRFVSLRPDKGSGNSILYDSAGGAGQGVPRSSSAYLWGPGRYPVVTLYDSSAAAKYNQPLPDDASSLTQEQGAKLPGEEDVWDSFQIKPKNVISRTQLFKTKLGSFVWRYASREEKKAADTNTLLILDHVQTIAQAQNQGSASAGQAGEEIATPVAHLVRSSQFRTKGTKALSAGNGGRLMIDTSLWQDKKVEKEMAEILAVTTCITMLKKEMDQ